MLLAVPADSVVIARQAKIVTPTISGAPTAPGLTGHFAVTPSNAVLPHAASSLSVPSLAPSLRLNSATALPAPIRAAVPFSAPAEAPRAVSAEHAFVPQAVVSDASEAVLPEAVRPAANDAPASGDARFQAASRLVARETAEWTRSAPADGPAPSAQPSSPRRSTLAKAALWTGVGALGLSAAASLPVAAPAVLVAAKGWLAWGGFSALAASTYLKPAAERGAAVPAPDAPKTGLFAEYRTGWARIGHAFDAQKALSRRVGDSDAAAFSAWWRGGLRAGLYASVAALLFMLGGALGAKVLTGVIGAAQAAASTAAPISDVSIAAAPFWGQLLGTLGPALVLETVLLKVVFDGSKSLLSRFTTPKTAAAVAGAAAVLGGLVAASFLTTDLAVLLPMAGIEAAIVWSYARSGSLLPALAARGAITWLSLESARVSVWLSFGTTGALAGLPGWIGFGAAGLLLAALLLAASRLGLQGALQAPGRALAALGERWRSPSADGAPAAFFPVLQAGLLWGLVTFATGDITYRLVSLVAPIAESAPDILAKVLTGPLDIVIFNFIIVGFLEEFVFRRNLFKPIRERLEKRGLSPRAVFWAAAVVSSLIFSYAHYIDFGALLARFGIGAGGAAAAAGSYVWSWASFSARATAGAVLAYQYWRSRMLLVPIVAHFASNTMEGLGLRWGWEAFLLMAAGALLLSLWRPKAKTA